MKKRRNTKIIPSQTNTEEDDIRYLFRQFMSIKSSEGISEGTLHQYKENFQFFCEYLNLKKY